LTFFVYFYLLLGFLINFFSKHCCNFSNTPPPPYSFVTVTLNSGISIDLVDIFNSFYDQIEHEKIMSSLANSYYYCKVYGLKAITLMDNSYALSNLKPISTFVLNNLPTFTFKPQNINIYFPIVNMFNICLQNIYIIIPAIIFTFKPIFVTFANNLNILLKKLLNLSKISWYLLLDNIIRHINRMITYKLILLLLDFLIEEFKVRIKHNNELYSKYMENFEVSRDFPLFSDDNSEFELICESMWLNRDTKQCKEILQTIRTLEYIIKTYFNSKYVEYPDKEFNPLT
jgi:hypothetical protein